MKTKLIVKCILLTCLFQYSSISQAYPKTEAEFSMLPPYCKVRMKTKGDLYKRWSKKLGGANWMHMHHYCSGLDLFNQARKLSARTEAGAKQTALKKGIGEMDYVLRGFQPNFVLIPEVHLKKGQALILLGQQAEGIREFYTAIKINPKYTLGYVTLSKEFMKQGDQKKAIEIIQRGLKHKPKSKSLNRQLDKLQKTK